MNLPNFISLLRLIAVPFLIFLIVSNNHAFVFWIFIGIAFSDALDGYLARRFSMETTLGKYLDPLADKALLIGVYITLGIQNLLPWELVGATVIRDLLIVMGVFSLNLFKKSFHMEPSFFSKVNTILQMGLAGIVLESLSLKFTIPEMIFNTFIVCVWATTLLSAWGYFQEWYKAMVKNG